MPYLHSHCGGVRDLTQVVQCYLSTTSSESTTSVVNVTSSPKEPRSILEDLAHEDQRAEEIFNITVKYNITDLNKADRKCISEVQNNPKLIAPFLVNITLDHAGFEMSYYHYYEYKNNVSSIAHAKTLISKIDQLYEDWLSYNSTVWNVINGLGHEENDTLVCAENSTCGCIKRSSFHDSWYSTRMLNRKEGIRVYILFGTFIDLPFRILNFIIGLIFNSALLATFIMETSVRSEVHIVIFNLLINNMLTILVFLPLQYVYGYFREGTATEQACHIFEILIVSVNVLVVLTLNAQRYFDISRVLTPNVQSCRFTPLVRCCMCTCFIWITSIVLSVLVSLPGGEITVSLEVALFFIVYTFIFIILIALFSALTAKKLQNAAKHGHTSTELQNITGTSVILYLTICFYLIFIPFFFFLPFDKLGGSSGHMYFHTLASKITYFVVNHIFTLYPALSCLVLYKCSSVYRRNFKKYLFRCWFNPEEGQYVAMSTLQNVES
ncbi:hypothetical protein C0J52_22922 [Blattella germanica]|nr:hypothetical protein C0J52_22922 [Blattella germanica]